MNGNQSFSHTTKSDIGVLVLHGYTGAPGSVLPQAEFFASKGLNVELPLLPGHGTVISDMDKVSYKDWIDTVEKHYEILKKRTKYIFVFGLSMGGALSLYLAEKHQEIKGVILVNNALFINDFRTKFLWFIKHFIHKVPAIANDIKSPGVKEPAYDANPTKSAHEAMKLFSITKKNIFKVISPTLIFKSTEDHVIPVEVAEYTYDKINSEEKKLIYLNDSYHVATLDNDKDVINEVSYNFIQKTVK